MQVGDGAASAVACEVSGEATWTKATRTATEVRVAAIRDTSGAGEAPMRATRSRCGRPADPDGAHDRVATATALGRAMGQLDIREPQPMSAVVVCVVGPW